MPETSPFLSAQMTVLTIFFPVFIVFGMYISVLIINGLGKWDGGIFNEETDPALESSRGHLTTTWTKFYQILTPHPPRVDKIGHFTHYLLVYDRNHYFGFGPIPKLKPELADTFGRYRNRYRNYISKGKSSYQ
jgi:hypothetical protein